MTLDNPGRFSRITAVVVNADYAKTGWNGTDWNWSHDQQPISLSVTEAGGTPDPGTGGGGQQTGGGGQQTAAAARRPAAAPSAGVAAAGRSRPRPRSCGSRPGRCRSSARPLC